MDSINYLLSIETRGIKLGLQRTKTIMQACGNPHLDLQIVQVAGTNGKGSVCAILANILTSANYKTGLFTSPHLVRINERIRINGKPIADFEIDRFIKSYKQDIEKNNITFFETTTALACWYFKKNNVDIVIMETGLGGRLDSVSICRPLATVITPISFDHMEILGDTLTDIAIEKAGIMKKNIVCLSALQKPEVRSTLQSEAYKKGAPLYFINNEKINNIDINIPGENQKENTKLALLVLDNLSDFKTTNSSIQEGLKRVQWYGRNQLIQKKPPIIFDVAHNEDSIKCFINYYQSLKIKGQSILVLALYFRKRIRNITPLIESSFQHIICTEADTRNPMKASVLGEQFNENHSVEIIKDSTTAIYKGINHLHHNGGMAILGTHYLAPSINKIFKISFDSV